MYQGGRFGKQQIPLSGSTCRKCYAKDRFRMQGYCRFQKYLAQEDIEQLQTFAAKFGAEGWIGLRFPSEPWYFLMLEDLEQTGKCWAISLELAQRKGLTMEELLGVSELQKTKEDRNV